MDDIHDGACPLIDPWSTEQRSKRNTPQSQTVNPVRQRSHPDSKAKRFDSLPPPDASASSLATGSRTGSGAKTLVSRNSKFLRTLAEGVLCAIPEGAPGRDFLARQVLAALRVFSVLPPNVNLARPL